MKAHLYMIVMYLLAVLPATGQPNSMSFGDHAQTFGHDMGRVLSAPASFEGNDWLLLGAVLGVTAAAWTVDEDVRAWSQQERTPALDSWTRVGDYYGTGEVSTGIALLLYTGGESFDDDWSRGTGRMVMQSLVYSELITHTLKAVLGRSRPYAGAGNADFGMFSLAHERTSFPSGHSTAAFALSTTLSRRIGHPAATAVLFSLAGLTMLQRIISDSHWLSDTVLGAAIGTATAWTVTELERTREAEHRSAVSGELPFTPHRPLAGFGVTL